MTLRRLTILAFLGVFSMSINSLSAQTKSSMKKSSKKEVETKQVDSDDENAENEKKTWTYVIMTLSGQEGNYRAEMNMAKSTDFSTIPTESVELQKKANGTVNRAVYATESDFLLSMVSLGLELVSVVNESQKNQAVKKYYFKREVSVKKEK